MKLLTKEEEDAHYREVVTGGIKGGVLGLGLGLGGAMLLQRRWSFFKTLTLPMKAFLVTSTGTFFAIVNADTASREYEMSRNEANRYRDETTRRLAEQRANLTGWEKAKDWGRTNRYSIVTAAWLSSMGGSLALVSRDKYLTTSQKLVQARMYAQGLTLLVLIATAAFEVADARAQKEAQAKGGSGMGHIEHYAGEDLWKDMVKAEERRLAAQKSQSKEQ